MYSQIKKKNEDSFSANKHKKQTIAKPIKSEKNNNIQRFAFMNSSPKCIQKMEPMELCINPETYKCSQFQTNTPIIQKKVPPQGPFKEVANTTYVARGGKDIMFDKDAHPRSKFSFGAHTRNSVFLRNNPEFAGNRIISTRTNTGEQANVEGVQLDHQVSWDTISKTMDEHNKTLGPAWNNVNGYSLWDAKMYYNDIDNLVPALGAINAAAGELGVTDMPRIHHGLEIYQGKLQTSWMNLQAGLVAVGHGINDDNAVRIANLLNGISVAMNDVTEQLL